MRGRLICFVEIEDRLFFKMARISFTAQKKKNILGHSVCILFIHLKPFSNGYLNSQVDFCISSSFFETLKLLYESLSFSV